MGFYGLLLFTLQECLEDGAGDVRRYTTQSHPVLQAVSFIEAVLSIDRPLYVQHVVIAGRCVGIGRDPVGAAMGNYLGKVKGQTLG